jgi:hypothetical protein
LAPSFPLGGRRRLTAECAENREGRGVDIKPGGYRVGYPLNFDVPRMKEGIIRMVSNL